MEILKKEVKLVFGLLCLMAMVFLQSICFATGADVTITAVKNFSNAAVSKPFIELYLGNIKPLSQNDPWRNPGAELIEEKTWDFSTGTYGKGIGKGDNVTVSARAWAEGTRAKGKQYHYGYLSGSTSG